MHGEFKPLDLLTSLIGELLLYRRKIISYCVFTWNIEQVAKLV